MYCGRKKAVLPAIPRIFIRNEVRKISLTFEEKRRQKEIEAQGCNKFRIAWVEREGK